jgi:hypothetical protein
MAPTGKTASDHFEKAARSIRLIFAHSMSRQNLSTVLFTSFFCAFVSVVLNIYTSLDTPYWYWSVLFLGIFSLASNTYYGHKYLPQRARPDNNRDPGETNKGSDFASLLLTGVIIRLLLSLVYLLVAWLLLRPSFLGCAVHFLLHYALFSAAEIRYLSLLASHRQSKP